MLPETWGTSVGIFDAIHTPTATIPSDDRGASSFSTAHAQNRVPFLRNLPLSIPRRQIASRVCGTCALLTPLSFELLGACLRVSLSSSMRYAPASELSLA